MNVQDSRLLHVRSIGCVTQNVVVSGAMCRKGVNVGGSGTIDELMWHRTRDKKTIDELFDVVSISLNHF